MAKTTNEKIQNQMDFIKQQENLLKKLKQQHRTEEKKARDSRLFFWGIAVEGVLKKAELLTEPYMTNEQVAAIFAEGLTAPNRSQTNGRAVFSALEQTGRETTRREENADNEGEETEHSED